MGNEAAGAQRLAAPGHPLSLDDADDIESRLQPWRAELGPRCLSDFCFSNLYLFRAAHDYRVISGDWPCISGLTYDGVRHVFPLFPLTGAPTGVLENLLAGHNCFYPVAAEVARQLDPRRFQTVWHEADADYLYPADNFRHYQGRLLGKKRNQMRQLLNRGELQAHPLTETRLDDARHVLKQWLLEKQKLEGEADDTACREALHLWQDRHLVGTVFYCQTQPIGFLMAQRLSKTAAVVRFAKGLEAYTGIYPFMFNHVSMAWPELEWLNFEQDLGLPNFRQTKRSYQPAALIEKYRVHLS